MEQDLLGIAGFLIVGFCCIRIFNSLRAGIQHLQFYSRNDSPGTRSRYLDWIVFAAAAMSLFGGVTLAIGMYRSMEAQHEKDLVFLTLVFGYMGFLGGLFFGTAVACAIAPTEFLASPAAKKWRNLIGTDNIVVARAVCVALASLIGVCYVGLLWL